MFSKEISYECQSLIQSNNITFLYLSLHAWFCFNSISAQNNFYLKDNKYIKKFDETIKS